jgi:hypothetical protein
VGETVFRFCGIGKTFHESENPVSLFETGTLIRFFGGRLSGLSRRFWLNRDRATQCVRGKSTPNPPLGGTGLLACCFVLVLVSPALNVIQV